MKQKILKLLSENDDYVSGEAISKELGVSRSAIWKHMKALRDSGYEIESSPKRGYRLIKVSDVLNQETLERVIIETTLLEKAVYLDTVGSTNDYAKSIISGENLIVAAGEQTAGRGRRGRVWESEKAKGIFMSFLLHPDMPPQKASMVTQVAALAVARALGSDFDVKWPNDIFYKGKKVCGILTEITTEIDRIEKLIIGIGINTKGRPDELKDISTSLDEIGLEYSETEIVSGVISEFDELYQEFLSTDDLDFMIDELNERSNLIGESVTLSGRKGIYTVISIIPNGNLVVRDDLYETQEIYFGEVSIRKLKN